MLTLISPAKTFDLKPRPLGAIEPLTEPRLSAYIDPIVRTALLLDDRELGRELSLSPKLVAEARRHWRAFVEASSTPRPAIEAYSGMVFKKLLASTFTPDDWVWAQDHLAICSFVYGLLRPLDSIRPYRMEGTLRLEQGQSVFEYWRSILTPLIIEQAHTAGGTLAYLASEEMKQLFHWEQVEAEVRVVYPTFVVRQGDGHLKQIVIYTKMARGLMTRAIVQERIDTPEPLQALSPAGFAYREELSQGSQWLYVLE